MCSVGWQKVYEICNIRLKKFHSGDIGSENNIF